MKRETLSPAERRRISSLGGKARREALSPKERSAIASRGGLARHGVTVRTVHEAPQPSPEQSTSGSDDLAGTEAPQTEETGESDTPARIEGLAPPLQASALE